MTSSLSYDPNPRARAAIERARILVGRAPYLSTQGRREASRALDALDRQLTMGRVNARNAATAIELLNRAHPSIIFALLREEAFAAVFAPALRELGIRGLRHRLDEVSAGDMAVPIPGPIGQRRHRDELPPEQRVDAEGRPLPPPPGYY